MIPRSCSTLLASAFARISPGNADLIADMRGLGVSVLGRAAPRLASAFRTSPVPFVLMLDDLHELRSPACHDVLGVVISGIPRGSQLVAASRFEQPHLPRLRVAGDALELLTDDLALDAAGAEQIFAEAQVSLTPELAAAVTERTEGWPVGLHLAAMIARDSDGEGLAVSGDDRYVADYLYRESVMHLPPRACSGSCGARRCSINCVLRCATPCSPSSGAQQQLRGLEASSLFLVPLDRRREWYRYHALFREFLLGELRRVEPDVIEKLHLRAADWYESNGSPAMALEHLLNTTERDRCVQLVTELTLPTYQAGQMSTVQRWLSALGDSAVEDYPPLAVLAGWIAVLTGQTAEAQRWAAIVDAASFDLVPLDGSASFDSARAMLRAVMCPGRPGADDGRRELRGRPGAAVEPMARHRALPVRRGASAHRRRRPGRCACSRSRPPLAAAMSNTDYVRRQRVRARAVGDGSRAMGGGGRARGTARSHAIDEHRMHDYATSVLAFAAAARLAVHRGDCDGGGPAARRGRCGPVRHARSCCPYLAVRLRLQLAKVYRAIGDATTARHLLREIDDILSHRPALGVLVDEVDEFRQILTSSAPAGATGGSPLTPAELRLLPYLQTHLTIREIGERLFVSRNTVSSEITLDLPETGRLLTQRRGATGDGGRPARRVADVTARTGIPTPRRCHTRAPSPASEPPRRRWAARRRE